MKKITITVNVAEEGDLMGNSVSRDYHDECTSEVWGDRIVDMLDTIEKSDVKEF